MIIVPKLGESNVNLSSEVLSVVGTKVEIQMNLKDLEASLNNSKKVIDMLTSNKKLDEVVLHMPFSLHTFEIYVASPSHLSLLFKFIKSVEAVSYKYDIKIGILLHQESSTELLETIDPCFKIINRILNSISNNNVYFLLENCLPCLNDYNTKRIPTFRLLSMVPHDKLFACIDVCHLRSYENIFKTTIEIPEEICKRVRWVHFSHTSKHDGFNEKDTHGVKHPTLQAAWNDLDFLMWNGIDISTTPIVTEITEKDYNLYPDMLEEIRLLNIFNNNVNIVHQRLNLSLSVVI